MQQASAKQVYAKVSPPKQVDPRTGSIDQTALTPVNVWILAGEENALGYGSGLKMNYPYRSSEVLPTEKIYVPGSGFQTLKPGTNNQAGAPGNIGAEVPMLRRLADEFPGTNVYLIKHAVSGSGMSYWLNGGGLQALKNKIQDAQLSLQKEGKAGIIKGIFWVAGEVDAIKGRTSAQYKTDLQTLYSDLCTHLTETIPIAIYKLHPRLKGNAKGLANIRQAQKEFCNAAPSSRFLVHCDKSPLGEGARLSSVGYCTIGPKAAVRLSNTNSPRTDATARYGPFLIVGTGQERQLIMDALDQIKFPWEELLLPADAKIEFAPVIGNGMFGFTTGNGHIRIEQTLAANPKQAYETISAEVAHAVDYGIPMTTAMKKAIADLTCNHPRHSWWPTHLDYDNSYGAQIGEGWMQMFTLAYSNIPYVSGGLMHVITPQQAPIIRSILGIQRTDSAAP